MPRETIRIAAVADTHSRTTSSTALQRTFASASEEADVLVIAGDLTDRGLPEEAQVLASDIRAHLHIPVVGVFGNHDVESGKEDEVCAILRDAGMHLLDGDSVELKGVGFAGIKGFIGGFRQSTLQPWGEIMIKQLVHETIEEALKLESALAKLRTPNRVVLMHYSPVPETLEGEPEQIFPFLGSSRLEEPLSRFEVDVVFHGHAHRGSPEGRTASGAPVYNVAMPLLSRLYPSRPLYRLFEVALPVTEPIAAGSAGSGHDATYSVFQDIDR
jgi:Icc-related predicted phosphoesterase